MARKSSRKSRSTSSSGKSAGARSDKVARRIDKLAPAMVEFLSEFCAIDTTNPPGRNYTACVRFLREKMKSLGMRTRIVKPDPDEQLKLVPGSEGYPRPSVVGLWDVGAGKTLHFTGHYDVVPATAGWKTEPFEPVIKGSRLYARGSSDMKGSDTAAIFAVQAMQEAGVTPPWNIELSFTPDEETGGYAGLGHLVRSGAIKPDAAVLCEGGTGRNVCIAHRGVLWVDVTVLGKPGHASNPKNGINALGKAISLIEQLRGLEKVYARRKTEYPTTKASQKHPTLMIGGISGGGEKVNTIPDRFHFTIDRRLNPEDKVGEVKAEIMAVIRKAQKKDKELKVKVDWPLYVQSGHVDPKSHICRVARQAVKAVTGKTSLVRMTTGFTDMHFLTRDGKVPTIGYGAEGSGAHADNEYVLIPSVIRTAKVYARIAQLISNAK